MASRHLASSQPETFVFTKKNLAFAKKVIARYPKGRQASAVIPLLWRAQEQHDGWLPEPAIRYVADMLNMAPIRVMEVATFYTMFQLAPVGRKAHIQVCGTTPCLLRGSDDIINICRQRIADSAHTLSADGQMSWEEVECLGACVNAPMVQIFKDTYEDLNAERFSRLLDDIEAGREVTPGPQSERVFSAPEDGPSCLSSIEDDTKGVMPAPRRIEGASASAEIFAGSAINDGGADFGVASRPKRAGVKKNTKA